MMPSPTLMDDDLALLVSTRLDRDAIATLIVDIIRKPRPSSTSLLRELAISAARLAAWLAAAMRMAAVLELARWRWSWKWKWKWRRQAVQVLLL
jgi:hypothetical protein